MATYQFNVISLQLKIPESQILEACSPTLVVLIFGWETWVETEFEQPEYVSVQGVTARHPPKLKLIPS